MSDILTDRLRDQASVIRQEIKRLDARIDAIPSGSGGGDGSGVTDGDKGDIVVSGEGAAWNFDGTVVTSFARTFLDDNSAGLVRSTLGLGSAATASSGDFAPTNHTHGIGNITGLQASLDGKLEASLASPFGLNLLNDPDASAARVTLGLGTAAVAAFSDFAAPNHIHSIANITGLQAVLDDKLDGSLVTAFGLSLINDVDAAAARATLALGTAATASTTDFAASAHVGSGGGAHSLAGASSGFMSVADKSKLDGIANGATVNSSDATLLARAAHTGTQPASTISDFIEASQDIVGGMIAGAGGTYDDAAGAITLPLAVIDPRGTRLETDFTNTNAIQNDFVMAGVGTGTSFTTAPIAGAISPNHPGVRRWVSGTTAGSGIQCMTSVVDFRIGGGEQFDFWFFTPPSFATIDFRAGFFDSVTSAAPVDGVLLTMSGTGAIVGRCRNNNAESATAILSTLAPATWYHGRFSVNAGATSVNFKIFSDSGAQLGSGDITTNIPTAAGREAGWGAFCFSSGTVAIELLHADRILVTNPGRTLQRGAA